MRCGARCDRKSQCILKKGLQLWVTPQIKITSIWTRTRWRFPTITNGSWCCGAWFCHSWAACQYPPTQSTTIDLRLQQVMLALGWWCSSHTRTLLTIEYWPRWCSTDFPPGIVSKAHRRAPQLGTASKGFTCFSVGTVITWNQFPKVIRGSDWCCFIGFVMIFYTASCNRWWIG